MSIRTVRKTLRVEGMSCGGCELKIEKALKKITGVTEAGADYAKGVVHVTYEADSVELKKLVEAIEKLDYKVTDTKASAVKASGSTANYGQLAGIGIIIFAIYFIIKNTIGFNFIPEVSQSMSYGLLFVVGLLTSLHCIAMCGGINLSQCVSYKHFDDSKTARLKPSFLYNAGRVVSYTVIGGIVGAIGSVVSFSGGAKGLVAIVAGAFMVLMGINMLNIFPALRKFVPRMPKVFGNKLTNNSGKNGPFYIGLLNGLMPCGPLQTMQLYALGTGSFTAGAISMFLFSLGTTPLMFGFGAASSLISKKFTKGLMKASAVLVMVLGFMMVGRGMMLSGVSPTAVLPASLQGESKAALANVAKIENGVQVVTIDLEPNRYAPIIVQKGIPVKFNIKAAEENINGCNNAVVISKFRIQEPLEPGDNIMEFTPQETGDIPYSCWMGMIGSTIKVVDDISAVTAEEASSVPVTPSSGGCGGGSCCQ